ncbi:MAG: DUF488 domain-containing protein [Planctomycetota bacterium]
MDGSILWTCGHSNRSLARFGELLEDAGIVIVCDVRSYPRSKRHPHFNRQSLDPALEEIGVRYCWLGRELGGMRSVTEGSVHRALEGDGRQGYADHMGTDLFRSGIEVLEALMESAPAGVAVMCAERDWRSCHRSLLSDYAAGIAKMNVRHALDPGSVEIHRVSELARVSADRLIYDRGASSTPELF